jgi:hypothetical protein
MEMKNNVVGWFEIPVLDLDRAIRFYETVFGFELNRQTFGEEEMAFFPWVDNGMGASGSLVKHAEYYRPADHGVMIYFTAHSGDVANEAGRVEAAGGTILVPKKQISEDIGYMAVFLDTEGNQVALHSRQG